MSGLCTNTPLINQKIIEDYLLKNVEPLLKEHIVKITQLQKEKSNTKSNRKEIETKIKRLCDLYVDGCIEREQYDVDRANLEAQIIDEPKEEIGKYLKVQQDFLKNKVLDYYETFTVEEKQATWRSIIKEIRISGKTVVDVIFL